MTRMTVTLGVRHDSLFPSINREPRQLIVHIDEEFAPDAVFKACNRIDSLAVDVADLPREWQRDLRYDLEVEGFPSMSVDDTIRLAGIGTWTCANRGWTFIPADRTVPL